MSEVPAQGGHEAVGARDAAAALKRATGHLMGLQHPDGWWKAELETNVTMDAEDLFLRHFLGILDDKVTAAAAGWIRSQQGADGSWATFYLGPGDLSTTVEAYVALRLAGDSAGDAHMAAAASWVQAHGGVDGARVFTRIWLAMLGRWDWEDLPVLPPEIMFLPSWAPLNIYDFGCWARQTIVALTVVFAHRPSRPLPFPIDELRSLDATAPGFVARSEGRSGPDARSEGRSGPGPDRLGRFFEGLDRVLHHYEHLPKWVAPRRALRSAALSAAERWIVRRQESDGCWGGIQPPLVYSVIALHLQGYPLDHPVLAAAISGMERFIVDDSRGRRVEACQSPVWDTALAVVALADAGVEQGNPAIVAASRWLLGEEVRVKGDWAQRRPRLEPGGWAFEFANDNYPDVDDTAEVVLALRRAGVAPGDPDDGAVRRAISWTIGMQCRGGGWGAFDVDNDSAVCAALPFCDFGEVIDPPSADVTAHALEMLAGEQGVARTVVDRAVTWLSDQQESDGSWFGRWGVNHIYGTGAAVPALVAAGVAPTDSRLSRAVAWLEGHQNDDGGWGEDLRSYVDVSWRGRGASTASQTAWALLALLAAGHTASAATRRGVDYLCATQTAQGTWDEPWFTGTGFPWDFSINYHLYRLVFPVMALGRYLAAIEGGAP